jgi:hypothetical protein
MLQSLGRRSEVRKALTKRSLLIGLAIAVFVNIASPYTESRAFSNFSWSYIPEGAMIPFLLILLIQIALNRIWPEHAFSSGELIAIFLIALISNSTPIFLIYFFLSAIVSPHYFSSPENRWDSDLIPYMRKWLIVKDPLAARWFYEGLPEGHGIPWIHWLVPLLSWFPFLFAVILSSYIAVMVLKKQWMEHEKLSYPIMQIPLALVEGVASTDGSRLFKGKLFWAGFLVPFSFMAASVLHGLLPSFPAIPVDHIGCLFLGHWAPVRAQSLLHFSFLAFGIGYFVPNNILLSIWVFYIATLFEEAIFNKYLPFGRGYGGMFVWGNAAISWQSFGAFFVMTLSSLLMARRHIWGFLKDGWRGERGDGINPRLSFVLFFGSLAFIAAWLLSSGMPPAAVAIFLPTVLLIYVGLARIVCQTGVFYVVPPNIAQNVVISLLGPSRIGHQGMVSVALSYSWHGDVQTVMPVLSAEGAKLWERAGSSTWDFSKAAILTTFIGILTSSAFIIWHGYKLGGAANFDTWIWNGWGPQVYNQVLSQIYRPSGPSPNNLVWFGIGSSAMALLTWLHLRFSWWPIHPVGLAVASSFTLYAVYLASFLSWLVKGLILRWFGLKTYRAAAPFFIGMVVGHFAGRAITLAVNSWLGIHLI